MDLRMFIKHGMHKSPVYAVWIQAKQRCSKATHPSYKSYGGRGITMCEEWRNDFLSFYRDMGPCPEGFTLERRNVNGNYEPANCYWADTATQARNKRRTIWITHNGETLCLMDWAKRTGISYRTISERHKRGQPLFEARIGRPSKVMITHDGITLTLKQWADRLDIPFQTLRLRYRKGTPLFAPLQPKYSSRLGWKA